MKHNKVRSIRDLERLIKQKENELFALQQELEKAEEYRRIQTKKYLAQNQEEDDWWYLYMKEYYVSFMIKGSFNNDFKSCFISTDKKITEDMIIAFRDKIAAEVQIEKANIIILGITLLDQTEGQ